MLGRIRAFMADRAVLEISAPVLGRRTVTDLHIESITALDAGRRWYLQTSPEYALKRVLAAGAGSVYALGPVFRAGEAGARHNPEFTMLEWYRVGFSLEDLMDEVAELLQTLGVDVPLTRGTYGELFEAKLGIAPHTASLADLQSVVAREAPDVELTGLMGVSARADRNLCLDLLFSRCIEPGLTGFVYNYPATQAALAEMDADAEARQVARRFEVYLSGYELANGYDELRDADELRRRIEEDEAERSAMGRPPIAPDESLLAAMAEGLPVCAGVAMGVERLLMALTGAAKIGEVMAFSADRA